VNEALSRLRDKTKWWPKVAEILAEVKAMTPPPQLPTFREAAEPDRTPEEVKRRMEVVAQAKRRYGWKPPEEVQEGPLLEPRVFDVPVSDASDDLKRLMRKVR
jgi:hypothetical protein